MWRTKYRGRVSLGHLRGLALPSTQSGCRGGDAQPPRKGADLRRHEDKVARLQKITIKSELEGKKDGAC
jgi:hypothetical protein